MNPPLGFNLSHDWHTVLLATRRNEEAQSASDLGVDVMRAEIPERETFPSFLESIGKAVSVSLLNTSRH